MLFIIQFIQNILPPPASTVQSFFGFLQATPKPDQQDTVLTVKHTVLAVAWLAINQMVHLLLPFIVASIDVHDAADTS